MKLLNLLIAIFIAAISFAQNEIIDTMGCDFGNPSLDVQYVLNYTDQECEDTCTSYYWIDILTADVDMVEITGPFGYYHVESGTNMTFASDSMLCPGDYIVVVYSEGMAQLCTDIFTIDSLTMLDFSLTTTNETGIGSCDGTATLDVTGGVLPYNITWYDANQVPIPNENNITIDSLCSGNYYYSVTSSWVGCCDSCPPCVGDSCGEVVFGGSGILNPFTIMGPIDLQVLFTMDEMCPFMCDGGVELQATGGTGNYTYTVDWWSQSSGAFYGLCPMQYTATVTDDVGNTATAIFEIFPAMEPIVDVVVMNESCNQSCDGYLLMNDQLMTIFYWSIDGGANYTQQNEYYNLCPGTYDLVGLNYNGCEIFIGTYTIAEGSSPGITNIEYTPASSPTSNDACINNFTVEGGSPPYSYTVDGNSFALPLCNLAPGSHTICVVDVNGCLSCEVFVIEACDIQLSTFGTNEMCAGVCDGSAVAAAIGTSGNESYAWYNDNGTMISSTFDVDGLCPGSYIVDVYDVNGCMATETVIIESAIPINIDVSLEVNGCNYPCNYLAIVSASGGVGAFEYSLDGINWSASNMFDGLCPDVYIAYVRDENDCVQLYTFIANETNTELTVVSAAIVDNTTEFACEGELLAIPAGGTEPYTFTWIDCSTNDVVSTTDLATGLCPGQYSVEVVDGIGCSTSSECDTIFGINGTIELSQELVIYPNPATDQINIQIGTVNAYSLSLKTLDGKVVYTSSFKGDRTQIDLNDLLLTKGIYLIEISSDLGQFRKRIIIQ